MDLQKISSMRTSDKVVGGVLLIAVVAGVLSGLWYLLPVLIVLAENAIYLGALLALGAVMLMILADKKTWTALYYGWQNISRRVRKLIVTSDPIGVLNTVCQKFREKLSEIDSHITETRAAVDRQDKAIKKAKATAVDELNLAKVAQTKAKELQVKLHAQNADRWMKSAEGMTPMLETLSKAVVNMQRARDLCEVRMQDSENQMQVLKLEYESAKAGGRAIKRLKGFLGRNADVEMQELAVEEIERTSSETIAEIDEFIRVINPTLEVNDLRNEAAQMAAMERFDAFLDGGMTAVQALEASKAVPSLESGKVVQLQQVVITKSEPVKEKVLLSK